MAETSFKLEWNGDAAQADINRAVEQAVTAAVLIAEGQIKQLTAVDTGGSRSSITHEITLQGKTVVGTVGSAMDHMIYLEYGTGEFAENGAGRKGGWTYKAPDGTYRFTYGNKPHRMFRNGYAKSKTRIIDAIRKRMAAVGGGK